MCSGEKRESAESSTNKTENIRNGSDTNRLYRVSSTENEYMRANKGKDDKEKNCNEAIIPLFRVSETRKISVEKISEPRKHNGICDITNETLNSDEKTNGKDNTMFQATGSIQNKVKPTKSNESISAKRKNSCFEEVTDDTKIENKENALYTIANLKKRVIETEKNSRVSDGNEVDNEESTLNKNMIESSVNKNPKRRKSEANMKKNCKVS